MQANLGLLFPQMPEDTFSHGMARIIWYKFDMLLFRYVYFGAKFFEKGILNIPLSGQMHDQICAVVYPALSVLMVNHYHLLQNHFHASSFSYTL